MTNVDFSSSFRRAYKKRVAPFAEKVLIFREKLSLFVQNPYNPQLKTHKLSGKLKHLWSFSVENDLRVLLYFVDEMNVIFEDIGSHDEVY